MKDTVQEAEFLVRFRKICDGAKKFPEGKSAYALGKDHGNERQ
jgi:hypothetical protein